MLCAHRLGYKKKEMTMSCELSQRVPNNALEPTAVGAFTMTIIDNITSPTPVMPLSTAVAQLGR
jgi:hypothetical protein